MQHHLFGEIEFITPQRARMGKNPVNNNIITFTMAIKGANRTASSYDLSLRSFCLANKLRPKKASIAFTEGKMLIAFDDEKNAGFFISGSNFSISNKNLLEQAFAFFGQPMNKEAGAFNKLNLKLTSKLFGNWYLFEKTA